MKIPDKIKPFVLTNSKTEIWLSPAVVTLTKDYAKFTQDLFYDGWYNQPAFLDTHTVRFYK